MRAKDNYLTVDRDYIKEIERFISKKKSGKVHFFEIHITKLLDVTGTIDQIFKTKEGEFILLGDQKVRLDKIVTLFGKPGPAYDDYDRYANSCFTCENLNH